MNISLNLFEPKLINEIKLSYSYKLFKIIKNENYMICSNQFQIDIFDISDINNVKKINYFTLPSDFIIHLIEPSKEDNILYIFSFNDDLFQIKILDISKLDSLKDLKSLEYLYSTYGVFAGMDLKQNFLYLIFKNNLFHILNFTDLNNIQNISFEL